MTTQESRQRVFGIQFMLLNLGLGAGGIVSALVVSETDPSTFVWLYLADATAYLAYFAVLLTLRGVGVGRIAEVALDEGGQSDRAVTGMREVLADRILRRVLLLAVVLLMSGYGALEVGVPIFITVIHGFSVSWVGMSFAVNTFTIVATQLLMLRFIRGRSRSYLIVAVAGIWAFSWILMGSSLLAEPALALILVLLAGCAVAAVMAVGLRRVLTAELDGRLTV